MGWGEAREGFAVGDSWLRSLRCGRTAGPTEVGLGRFVTVRSLAEKGPPG